MDGMNRQRFEDQHAPRTRRKRIYRCILCGRWVDTGRRVHRKGHRCKACQAAPLPGERAPGRPGGGDRR